MNYDEVIEDWHYDKKIFSKVIFKMLDSRNIPHDPYGNTIKNTDISKKDRPKVIKLLEDYKFSTEDGRMYHRKGYGIVQVFDELIRIFSGLKYKFLSREEADQFLNTLNPKILSKKEIYVVEELKKVGFEFFYSSKPFMDNYYALFYRSKDRLTLQVIFNQGIGVNTVVFSYPRTDYKNLR